MADIPVTFYRDLPGMGVEEFRPADGSLRTALTFGRQKIDLHEARAEFEPEAARPLPGSADLCLLSDVPVSD